MNESNEGIAARRTAAPRPWILGLAVLIATWAVYVNSLDGPFMWDDHQLIESSSRISELRPLREYFQTPFWAWSDFQPGGRSYYRPLSILSFAIDHFLHGANPGGFHVTNLVFHGANAALLFVLLLRRELDATLAALLALVWACFPRLTEAAAWISGRTDVLAATFVLLGFLFTLQRTWFGRVSAALSVLVGLFAKEVAAAGLLGVAAFEWRESRGLPLRSRAARLLPIGAAAVAYGGIRAWGIGPSIQENGLSPKEVALAACEATGRYAFMLLDGWQPSIRIGNLGFPDMPFVILGGLVFLPAAFASFRFAKRADATGLMMLTTALGSVGLVLHILPITVNVIAADRFLYLPLAAIVLALAPGLHRFKKRNAAIALALLLASYLPVTWTRIKIWADEVDFWTTALREQQTHNAGSRLELGNVYGRAGMHSHALSLYLDPDSEDITNYLLARANAGTALIALGRLEEGRNVLLEVVRNAPQVPRFQFGLAFAHVSLQEFDEAEKHLKVALQLFPDSIAAKKLQGIVSNLRKTANDPVPDATTLGGRLTLARRYVNLGRSKDALNLLVEASADPQMGLPEVINALLYAFDSGTPRQLTALYESYTRRGGNDPAARANYQARMERVRRLRELWPTLSAHRTKKED
ncbi:MAG TPA: tetratricopeptide repeat protein [Polyangiaceae bacterium]|nr:tetratricopeptide repeat protein [Polyangiaceae bacterium]